MIAELIARIVLDVRQFAHRERAQSAWVLIRVFYIFAAYTAADRIMGEPWHLHAGAYEPLWPLAWTQGFPVELLAWVFLVFVIASCIAAAIAPENRTLRIGALLGLLAIGAFTNSFGKIGHNLHYWIYVAIVFVFLPARGHKDADVLTLTTFWCAQFVILSTYALAGLWKVVRAVIQSSEGMLSIFDISGPVYILVNRTLKNGDIGVWSGWVVAHPEVLWVAFWAVVLMQCLILMAAYFPRFHRAAGVILIAFHTNIYLVMGISFLPLIPLLGLLFICSPFAPPWSGSSAKRGDSG